MGEWPLAYVRTRLARSIDARVRTATQISTDTLRAEMARSVDDLLARLHAAQSAQDADYGRLLAELRELLRSAELLAADHASESHLGRQRAEQLKAQISATATSVGSLSASITDAQREQAAFIEQLARRVEALEQTHRPSVADSSEPAS